MKILKKPGNEEIQKNAIPGVFALLKQTDLLVMQERNLFAGYAAWLILPALATFGFSFAEVSSFWHAIVTNLIFVGEILLWIWVYACLTLLALSRLHKEPLEHREISALAKKSVPTLLYLFAFSLLCIIFGMYLLVIPGILAFVWLAFSGVIALEKPGTTFSQAISRSKKVSKGVFFNVFWKLLTGNLLFLFAYFAFCLVTLGTIFFFAHIDPAQLLNDATQNGTDFPAWMFLLVTALFLPFVPHITLYPVVLYDALKTR